MTKDFSLLFFLQLITGSGVMFVLKGVIRVIIWDNQTLYDRITGVLAGCIMWILFLSYSAMAGIRYPIAFVEYSYLPVFFTVGPVIYIFVRASVDPDYRLTFVRTLHFLPVLVSVVFLAVYFFGVMGSSFDRYPFAYLVGGSLHFLDYIFFAALLHGSTYYSYLFYKARSFLDLRGSQDIGPASIFFRMFFFGAIIGILPILGYVFRSEMVMWTLCALMSLIIMFKTLIQLKYPELFDQLSMALERASYKKSRLVEIDIDSLGKRIMNLFEVQKIYIDENLNVAKMAEMLNVKDYQLREYVNVHLHTNFPALVNQYRIAEAVGILEATSRPNMLNIAFRVGFNSKATFNLAFRKVMGSSPTEYLRKTEQNVKS